MNPRNSAIHCALLLSVVLTGCGPTSPEELPQTSSSPLAGSCGAPLGGPPPASPPALPLHSAPLELSFVFQPAPGIRPPRQGRVALVAFVPGPGGAAGHSHLRELSSIALPAHYPAAIQLPLAAPPESILREVEASLPVSGAPSRLSLYVVVYDDVDEDGRMGLGTDYPPAASEGASAQAWLVGVGSPAPDFLGWSSATDPKNEILTITPVLALYHPSKNAYELAVRRGACPGDLTALNPSRPEQLPINWSLRP